MVFSGLGVELRLNMMMSAKNGEKMSNRPLLVNFLDNSSNNVQMCLSLNIYLT